MISNLLEILMQSIKTQKIFFTHIEPIKNMFRQNLNVAWVSDESYILFMKKNYVCYEYIKLKENSSYLLYKINVCITTKLKKMEKRKINPNFYNFVKM